MTTTTTTTSAPLRPDFDAANGATFIPYTGKSERRRNERALNAAAELLFPDGPPPSYSDVPGAGRGRRPDSLTRPPDPSQHSNSSSTAVSVTGHQPQQIKSMLDI
ncbi:hypothetical protein CH063_15892 [Colletotrichum higginsianum]|uniref:Uncharacterized protein n=1 Tax=Colletotrichum higginsianum (strain IMI 349063) TaxID=759273 RepID=H1W4Y0_COLHI|nr:hypothetical protein CH063_15892 [Colletotrichum higginsianum]